MPDNDSRDDYLLLKVERTAEAAADKAIERWWGQLKQPAKVIVPLIVAGFGFIGYTGYSKVDQWISGGIEQAIKKHSDKIDDLGRRVEELQRTLAVADQTVHARVESTREYADSVRRTMIRDVEAQRQGFREQVDRDFERISSEGAKVSKSADGILNQAKAAVQVVEQRTQVVRMPLKDKLKVLEGLRLDMRTPNRENETSLAILVLRDLADPDLVGRERVRNQARSVLGDLANKDLTDEYFQDVRALTRRAVVELRLTEVMVEQVMNPSAWERPVWILCLGALEDRSVAPKLVRLVKEKTEDEATRDASLRALAEIMYASRGYQTQATPTTMAETFRRFFESPDPLMTRDEGVMQCRPRTFNARPPQNLRPQDIDPALEAAGGIVTDAQSSKTLRKTALWALGHMWTPSASDDVEDQVLAGIERQIRESTEHTEQVLAVFGATHSVVGTRRLKALILDRNVPLEARLKAVRLMALPSTSLPGSFEALQEIGRQESADEQIRKIAIEGSQRIEKLRAAPTIR